MESSYDRIMEKNINKGYYKPRSIKTTNEITLDDVLYKSNNKSKKYANTSKYINGYSYYQYRYYRDLGDHYYNRWDTYNDCVVWFSTPDTC